MTKEFLKHKLIERWSRRLDEGPLSWLSQQLDKYLDSIKDTAVKLAVKNSPEMKDAKKRLSELDKELITALEERYGKPLPPAIRREFNI